MIERRRKKWERETKKIKKTKWKLGLDLVGRAANKSTQQRANTLHTPPKYKATFLPPLPSPPLLSAVLTVMSRVKCTVYAGAFPKCLPSEAPQARNKWSSQFAAAAAAAKKKKLEVILVKRIVICRRWQYVVR